MKNSVSGGKNMDTVYRTRKKFPSDNRIKKLLEKKNLKKELNNGQKN